MMISLGITRLVVNQLTLLWYGVSVRDFFFILSLHSCEDCLFRDVINTCDDTIYNLSAYVCDWSLSAHKILYPILSLKLGVTVLLADLLWKNTVRWLKKYGLYAQVDRAKAGVRADLGTDGFDFQQLECTIDCFLLEGYSSFNKSYFLFRSWLSNSGTDDWIVNSLFFPIFGAHVVYVPPAVQQSQCSWVHGAKELDKLRGMLLVKCFIGGEDFPLISRTGTMSSGWGSRPSFPEREQCSQVEECRPRPIFFFCAVSTCRCKLQEASMCSFCELTAIFFIVNHNTEPGVYMTLYTILGGKTVKNAEFVICNTFSYDT